MKYLCLCKINKFIKIQNILCPVYFFFFFFKKKMVVPVAYKVGEVSFSDSI